MIKKECLTCGKEYPETKEYFIPEKRNKSGISSCCKKCRNKWLREYYNKLYKVKQSRTFNIKKWKTENRIHCTSYMKDYHKENKDREREYRRLRKIYLLKNNINYKIKHYLSSRLRIALRNNFKSGRTMDLLGCNIDYFKYQLACKFEDGMSFDNYGKWHIDHIKPCAKFDLYKPEEQKKCFHFTNLQPLWAIDNIKKAAR